MNHRESKEKNLSKERNQIQVINHTTDRSIPIKQTNTHRSCLKHRSSQPEDHHDETIRSSSYRVSFAHPNSKDGKILVKPSSQNDLGEKKRRSDMFVKKAKELQLAEITYFKDHARDKDPTDE